MDQRRRTLNSLEKLVTLHQYLLDGQLTEKSEVFAFGKKTVEKLGPGECETIITWAMLYLTDRTKLTNVIDPLLRHDGLETSLPGSSSGGFVRAARTEL